mgnify:CR=1 FL=1
MGDGVGMGGAVRPARAGLSAAARVEAALARIAAQDGRLRAVIEPLAETARAEAAASDARAAAGASRGPLDGVLVGIKDNLAVAGRPRTGGIGALAGDVRARDAGAVARLRAAGAVVLARLNMHEGATGGTSDNLWFGRCVNPLGGSREPPPSPGGSSGGSAVAVVAGFVEVALGTDTLASVRLPAAFCGLAGIKPTFGVVGRSGLLPMARSLDVIGPLARDVRGLWPVLAAIAGEDAEDPDSVPPPAFWAAGPGWRADLGGVRLGRPVQVDAVAMEPEARAAFEHAASAARRLGAEVRDVDLAGWRPAESRRAGLAIAQAEGAAALGPMPDMAAEGIGAELRAFLAAGAAMSAEALSAARAEARAGTEALERAEAEVDALILPTSPQRAFPHGAPPPHPLSVFTALANLSGRPALTLPVPAEGLPGAVQLMGPMFSDPLLIALGAALEDALPG